MYISGLMVSKSMFLFSGPKSFSGWGKHGFGYFVIFVIRGALIVSRWMVVTWSRKSSLGLAEISSFVFLV